MTTPTTDHDHLAVFARRADRFTEILDAVDGSWEVPTPCEGWSARDVVAHVIETERDFLERQDLDPGPSHDVSDPPAAWRAHHRQVTAALDADGVAERGYDGYFGPTTIGATMADFYGWDLVVHGGDIARATGQDWSVSDEEAAALHAAADTWGDALHSEGVCGPALAVADDASATDRLLARLGRDPRWTPPTTG